MARTFLAFAISILPPIYLLTALISAAPAQCAHIIEPQGGHTDTIFAMAISADNKTAVTAGADLAVRVWDVESGRNLHTLIGHTKAIYAVAFSPDGKFIASADSTGVVLVWNTASGRLYRRFVRSGEEILQLAFSADGHRLATGDRAGRIYIWKLESGMTPTILESHSDYVQALAFSEDGKYLVSGSKDQAVKIWDLETKVSTHTFDSGFHCIGKVGFRNDGRAVFAANDKNEVKAWSRETFKELSTDEVLSIPGGASFQADGVIHDHLFGPFYSGISILNGRKIESFIDSTIHIEFFVISKDGQKLLTAGSDNVVRVWDVATRHELQKFAGHSGLITAIVFTPDGKGIAVDCIDGVRFLEKRAKPLVNVLADQSVGSSSSYSRSRWRFHDDVSPFALNYDGQAIAYVNQMRSVSLGLLESDKIMGYLPAQGSVLSLKFSPDLQTIAVWTINGIINLYSVKGKSLHSFEVGRNQQACMSFNAKGDQLAVGGSENVIFDVVSGARMNLPVFASGCPTAITYSADGNWIARDSVDGTVGIFNASTGKEQYRFKEKFGNETSLAFSDDSKFLAIGDRVLGLRLWRVGTSTEPQAINNSKRPTHSVRSLAFTHDGKFLATGDGDNAVSFWDVSSRKLKAKLYLLAGKQWAIVDDSGHFDCSAYGRVLLRTKIKNRYVDLREARESYYRPGLMNKLFKIDI
ncbi:MAG: WD40 repeat domain-containing protein [Candidatus Obscuribacterales bacterium]